MKLYPNTNIQEIRVGKAQRGWVCDLFFSCEVHTQLTHAHFQVRGHGKKYWMGVIGLLLSVLDALKLYTIEARKQQAVVGEFNKA